jgi:uncharacterized protein YkvS
VHISNRQLAEVPNPFSNGFTGTSIEKTDANTIGVSINTMHTFADLAKALNRSTVYFSKS